MSTKPNLALARWADTGGADKIAPGSGERDVGFQAGDPADQSIVNELLYQHYTWDQYLSDGALSGTHSVDGDVTIGGQALTFVDFTFTANAGTDQIAHTAHGLLTGDGPVRVSNSGGGLPGGLAAGTDYWFIKSDADSGKLATTRARALKGLPINLTSAGTGTHTLLHQGGTTRARSTVLNGTVDATDLLPVVNAGYPAVGADWVDAGGTGVFEAPSFPGAWGYSLSGRLILPLRLPIGAVLTKVRLMYDLVAAGNSMQLWGGSRVVATGTASETALVSDAASTTYTTFDVTNFGVNGSGNFDASAGPHEIGGDRVYWLAMVLTRVSGTIIFYGAVINPPS